MSKEGREIYSICYSLTNCGVHMNMVQPRACQCSGVSHLNQRIGQCRVMISLLQIHSQDFVPTEHTEHQDQLL